MIELVKDFSQFYYLFFQHNWILLAFGGAWYVSGYLLGRHDERMRSQSSSEPKKGISAKRNS